MKSSRRSFIKSAAAAFFALAAMKLGAGRGAFAAAAKAGRRGLEETPVTDAGLRVVSVHSPYATNWDFKAYPYVDHINYEAVKNMLNEGIMALSGEKDKRDAWHSVFSSYRPGDNVAIKPNFNDLHAGFRAFVASPAVLNAVIDGLVKYIGAAPGDITVYDCTREIPDEYRRRISSPVNFVEPSGSSILRMVTYHTLGNRLAEADPAAEIKMTTDVKDKEGRPIKCYVPRVVTGARHLINIPILKSHQFISNSGALKNHYGTVRFSDGHGSPEYLHPPIIHESIADINAAREIQGKTRLVVMDGLFGRVGKRGGQPERWNIFGGNSPNRLFLSRDPVAIDSVALKFIGEEMRSRNEDVLPHDYLHIAAERGIGVHEDPENGGFKRIELSEISA